jgi:EAL domain-containing protein (putative c-di-GMP-specific phosphodiesterase class I)
MMLQTNVDVGEIYKILNTASFFFKYEPIYNVCANEIYAYEALLRLKTKDLSLQKPDNFIALAEVFFPDTTNKILYDMFLLSAKYIKEKIHFNLSINNLKFLDTIDLRENIVFEITEETLSNSHDFAYIKNKYKQGFKFAIDDFGKGYNSFLNIMNNDVKYEYIKFDKEFLVNLREERVQNILRGLRILFEKDYGCRVLIEGVETKEEYATLCDLGFCFMQGWFFKTAEEEDLVKGTCLL